MSSTGRKYHPSFTVLSHMWDEGKVAYKDYVNGKSGDLKCFDKIARACRLAASSNIDYLWVDTCCIDKSSSAELPETIKSMFAYHS
ncbi:hypothetical protein F5Y18DRAFT_191129 [Xylariaceae sp. FL1019]|nr:hypothetical protein F5Y18DRAFT_191129 [Xylariaceae sp. FL1019]